MKLVTFITSEGYLLISLKPTLRLSYSTGCTSCKSALSLLFWVTPFASTGNIKQDWASMWVYIFHFVITFKNTFLQRPRARMYKCFTSFLDVWLYLVSECINVIQVVEKVKRGKKKISGKIYVSSLKLWHIFLNKGFLP